MQSTYSPSSRLHTVLTVPVFLESTRSMPLLELWANLMCFLMLAVSVTSTILPSSYGLALRPYCKGSPLEGWAWDGPGDRAFWSTMAWVSWRCLPGFPSTLPTSSLRIRPTCVHWARLRLSHLPISVTTTMCWVLCLKPRAFSHLSQAGNSWKVLEKPSVPAWMKIWAGGEEKPEHVSTSFYQMGEPAYRLDGNCEQAHQFQPQALGQWAKGSGLQLKGKTSLLRSTRREARVLLFWDS